MCQKNAEKNGVYIDTLLVFLDHVYEKEHYDIVVANILAVVLTDMAKNLAQSLKSQGILILSGILLSQKNDVINAYQAEGLSLVKQTSMDDWCALQFRKP